MAYSFNRNTPQPAINLHLVMLREKYRESDSAIKALRNHLPFII